MVQNNGWIGFGISPNGGMLYSDVAVTFVNPDGSVNFTNRHMTDQRATFINANPHWFLLYFSQNGTTMTSIFTRKINICGVAASDNPINISPGTQYVIFSWGNQFIQGDITYHGPNNRSSTSLPLISTVNQAISLNMTGIEVTDFTVNVRQPH